MEGSFYMRYTKQTLAFLTSLSMLSPAAVQSCAAEHRETGIFDIFTEKEELPGDVLPERGDRSPDKEKKTDDLGQEQRNERYGERVCGASTPGASGWYCKHMEGGERPPLPPEMSFIGEHGGYYLGEDEKVIYLTFDAGYENGNVERILDTLRAEGVPAAFFILENLVSRNTALVQRMIDEGHTVCNHTAVHPDMTTKTEAEFGAELARLERVYKDTMGVDIAKYYRPPEGRFTEENLKWAESLGYRTVFWSYAYADWDNEHQPPTDKALQKVLSGTHNGEVLLLHPTSSTNADILPRLIGEWKRMGYRFGTLDELTERK